MSNQLESRDQSLAIKDYMSNLPLSGAKKYGSDLENMIQWLLSPEQILNTLDHNLRGEIPGERPGEWIQIGEQMLNDLGIRKILSICATRVNKIVIMSNFDDRQIHDIMFYIAANLRNDMFQNFEKYEMEFHNLDTVVGMAKDLIYAALLQAKGAGARTTWSRIQRVTHNIIEDMTGKKKQDWTPGDMGGGR